MVSREVIKCDISYKQIFIIINRHYHHINKPFEKSNIDKPCIDKSYQSILILNDVILNDVNR